MYRFATMYTHEGARPSVNDYGYGLATFIKVKTGSRNAFVDAMSEVARAACLSPGCIEYLVSGVQNDPDGVFITELWRSHEDQHGALQSPAIVELIDRCSPLIDRFDQKPLIPLS
jgi:quinol monooxygenase YgiN